jgi:hypothetical protein
MIVLLSLLTVKFLSKVRSTILVHNILDVCSQTWGPDDDYVLASQNCGVSYIVGVSMFQAHVYLLECVVGGGEICSLVLHLWYSYDSVLDYG